VTTCRSFRWKESIGTLASGAQLLRSGQGYGSGPCSFHTDYDPLPGEAGGRRGSEKQVSNARMLAELQVKLTYPTYHEGLAAASGFGSRSTCE
jgi:hypothetical protein